MNYTDTQLVNVVRNAVEGALQHPQPFRCHLPSGHLDVDAFKRYFCLTAGIASNVRADQKDMAWHVELLDEPERERVLEVALRIYRAPSLNGVQ
jgi:hypothetical protein